jgi:regulator of protease activity HflC (stomatin/prohibitin superfamily)
MIDDTAENFRQTLIGIAVLFTFLIFTSVFLVKETEQVMVVRFGNPSRKLKSLVFILSYQFWMMRVYLKNVS